MRPAGPYFRAIPRARRSFRQKLIRPGAHLPHITRILPAGAAPVPFGLWEGRPGGWGVVDVTAHHISRDVDPGKPDQKAGRESPLARLSSERSRELMVSGQGLAAPKSSRILLPETPGAARRAKAPTPQHIFSKGAAAPAAQAPPWGHTNCSDPGWPRQSGQTHMETNPAPRPDAPTSKAKAMSGTRNRTAISQRMG